MTTILTGHVSPETAYVVADYPYGFRLRCSIRYWLEYKAKVGVRMMSQTSNPKRPGLIWNKPKASIYGRFGGCMYLDDSKHVQFIHLHEYMDAAECVAWMDTYGAGVPDACKDVAAAWVRAKLAYDARRAAGQPMATAAAGAVVDSVQGAE